jgi:hypothetical protein
VWSGIGLELDDRGGQVMKSLLRRAFALVGIALLVAPAVATAEVQQIEIDVAGYLCGL